MEFRIHPLGTNQGEGWFIGIGAIGGMRLGAHTKTTYNHNGNEFKEKLYNKMGANRFRLAFQARFGFRNIHLYYKYYLNNVFKASPNGGVRNPTAATIGINISGF